MRKQFTKLLMLVAMMMPLALLAQTYESVPYTTGFETSSGSPALPAGWVNYQTGTSGSGSFPCCYQYPGNARNGDYYFELESRSNQQELCATSEFADLSGLMLEFYYCINSGYAPTLFEIGVMEDSVFVPIDTVNFVTVNSWNSYTRYRMNFAEYTGDGHRIAFRATGSSYTIFIDDLTVDYAPLCPYTVRNISATVDSNSATLTWSEPMVSASYFIYLNNDSNWYDAYTNSYTFTGLTANTLYTGLIYNSCNGSDSSEAVEFSFRTACAMPEFPLIQSFDDNMGNFPTCWYRVETDGSYPQNSTSSAHTGTYGMNLYSYSSNISFASPYLYEPIESMEVKFWARKSSTYYNNNLIVGFTIDPTSGASFVGVDTINLTTEWTEYTVSFANTEMHNSGHIMFRKPNSGDYGNIYIDDITIRAALSCATPTDFMVSGTASGELSFAWADTLGSAWQIAYGTPGFDPDTAIYYQDFYETYGTVDNLEDTLTYDFYLRSDCGGEYSYWLGPVTARPTIFAMRPNQADTVRMCGGTITDDGGLFGESSADQTSYLVIYPNVEGQTVSLHGTASTMGSYTYYENILTIYEGVGTTGRVLGSWSNTTNDSVNVSSNLGAITLKYETDYYPGPGFELQVSCSDAANCFTPWNLTVSDITGGTANVHWEYSDMTPADGFTIVAADTASGASFIFYADDTARSAAISGLNQHTNYRISVYANCSTGDDSEPVSTFITTGCFVGGTVTVGEGNASLNHIINTYYNYSICQMLFTADEILQLQDTIFGIEFYVNSATNATVPLDIYLDTTSVSAINSSSDYITMDSADLVWSGSLVLQPGANTFNFDTPFIRPNMSSNLVLTLDNNSGSYTSYSYIVGTNGQSGKTLYAYSDGTNYDPMGTPSVSATDNRANITFLAPCADANCVAPSLTLGSATPNSITINWVPGMSENEWTVEYKLHTDTTWTVSVATTTAQTATISGLMANTVYDFRVGSICLVGNMPYSYISGRTACDVMSRTLLPLTEGFEGFNTGDVPFCWVTPATGTSSAGTFPSCYNHNYNAHSGDVYFEVESSTGGTEIFALPAIDDINGTVFGFWIATGGTSSPDALELGVIENDTNFVVLDTVDLAGLTSIYNYQYRSYRINYAGTNGRIAMRATKPSSYTIFLDDFELYVPNPCDSVINLAVDTLYTTGFSISWDDTASIGSYIVKLGTSSNAAVADTTIYTTSTSYTFTGLTPSTIYYAFVYADCGTGISDENRIMVATPCESVNTFPWEDDFESGMGLCYDQIFVSGNHQWSVTTTTSNPGAAHSGNYVAAYTHTSNNTETMLVLPTFDFSSLSTGAELNFFHTQFDWSGDQDQLHIYYRTSLTGEWTLLQSYTNAISSWTEETLSLPASAGASIYQIAFKGVDGYGYGVKIDDITVGAGATCNAPALLSANVSDVSAVLSWNGNASQYTVEYRNYGSTTSSVVTAYADSIMVTGFEAMHTYQFRVQGICAPGDTSRWSEWFTFTTLMCTSNITVLSYDTNATATTSSYAPMGYSYYNYGVVQTLVKAEQLADLTSPITAMAFSTPNGNQGSYFSNMDIYLANVPDSMLSSFIVPDSTLEFVKVLEGGNLNYTTGGWHTFGLDTTFAWDGTSNLLVTVFRNHGGYSMGANFDVHNTTHEQSIYAYRDGSSYSFSEMETLSGTTENYVGDLQFIACLGGCIAPRILSETHDYENVTINWSNTGNTYEVAIKANDVADWPASTTVTGTSFTFTGLNAATAYTYRVRQDCSADEMGFSAWTMGAVVTDSLPCFAPDAVTASNITNNEVTLAWNENGLATNWEVRVWANGINDQTVATTTNPTVVTGLTPAVTYNAAVRSLCGSALVEGDWSDTISFTTLACPDVTGLASSNVTFNSVDLNWDNNAMAQGWIIEYGYQGFNQGQGTTVNASTNSIQITGLDSETSYDFYVRAICGTDWTSENWAHVNATTAEQPADVYVVTLLVNDPAMGTVTGAGTYAGGTTVTISATANEGYNFVNWSDGNTDATRSLVVNSDITLTANFQADDHQQGIDEVNGVSCTIYPNPATSSTTVSVAGVNGKVSISVVDMNGRVLSTETLECAADCVKTMDIDNLAQGTYFVRIISESVNMVKKLVVR